MTTVYGIKNCDTVKKARQWLEQQGVDFRFHDFRVDGLNEEHIAAWRKQIDWQTLLNKRSTTWKKLDDNTREALNDDTVVELLVAHPTLIKRPVMEHDGKVYVGFKISEYEALFL